MLHWKFCVHDCTIGGMCTASIPTMACACTKLNSARVLPARWAAALEWPCVDVNADAASPSPEMMAVDQPTPAW
jgi:hypothetical protein